MRALSGFDFHVPIDIISVVRYNVFVLGVGFMVINELLGQKGMTKYRLAKESRIPHTTVLDICSGKVNIKKATGETLYKIAQTLGVSIEDLLEDSMEYRQGFEAYKSSICHLVKNVGDFAFIVNSLKSGEIRRLFNKKWYPECLYLLAMVDYLSRENGLPVCSEYSDIRATRLSETIYPSSVVAMSVLSRSNKPKQDSHMQAIPEFLRFNIVESEVRNVC
jgi:transcriptional regulator with XRE-family HTH domain